MQEKLIVYERSLLQIGFSSKFLFGNGAVELTEQVSRESNVVLISTCDSRCGKQECVPQVENPLSMRIKNLKSSFEVFLDDQDSGLRNYRIQRVPHPLREIPLFTLPYMLGPQNILGQVHIGHWFIRGQIQESSVPDPPHQLTWSI